MISTMLILIMLLSVISPTVVMANYQGIDDLSTSSQITVSGSVMFNYKPSGLVFS